RPEELYLDVSTGQNIYVNALVEAARRYATYRALEAALEGGAFEIHILTYQPITSKVKEEVDVHLYTLRPTAHLQLPPVDLNSIFRNNSDKPKLKNYSQHRERLNVMYKEVKRAFNALTYGIPLAFYQILKFTAEEGELEKTAIELVKSLQRENTPLRLVETTNIFFAIALYKSFKKFKNTLTEPYIDEIRDRFSELYKRIKMPAYDIYIRRELDDIEVRLKDIPYCKREVNLTEIYHTGGSGDRRRNFFAHAGFIKDYTKATREDGRIKLMWLEERIGEITSWIDNP
ncbi:MAG: TM1812 family CRISPR-associated protein, partial [Pyrobaculum sp.]